MEVGRQLFAAVYGQPAGISMTQAWYNMCIKQGEPLHIMAYHVSTINRHESLPSHTNRVLQISPSYIICHMSYFRGSASRARVTSPRIGTLAQTRREAAIVTSGREYTE